MKTVKALTIFAVGGMIYGLIELAWRGHTHISMFVAGGICLLMIDLIARKYSHFGMLIQSAVCAVMITAVEFAVGMVVNVWLGLDVWNYSGMPANIMGQVCPQFTALWYFLSFPAMLLASKLRVVLFGQMPAKMQLLPNIYGKTKPAEP